MADNPLKAKLEELHSNIKESWTRDCDRVESYIALNDMLKEIATKDSIEEYFSNDEAVITFFLGDFIKEVLYYILKAYTIYGENGDEIGLESLINIYNLFLKFHKNKKYSAVFELIRGIFNHDSLKHNFFESSYRDDKDSIKKYDYTKFNSEYNSEFISNSTQDKKFAVGDIVDIPIEYEQSRLIDKNCWIRAKIQSVSDKEYTVEFYDGKTTKEKKINFSDLNIFPCGTKTADWDWRSNLKKWDLIDCYDRSKWYPSTITSIMKEKDVNGVNYLVYHVGFRIYPEHFNNLEDPEDIAKNHINVWKSDQELETDSSGEKYYGDREGFDENIPLFSKRIQKFNTFSKLQLKYLNYSYSASGTNFGFNSESDRPNPLKLMNDNLYSDTELNIDQFFKYEKDGKKNIIIGKTGNFSCFFALFLKKIEKENGFEQMMDILKAKPDSEEIYTVFYILYHCFNYIHIDFFKENAPILKNVVLEFVNNLDDKEMKKIPKDFRNIITDLFEKINSAKLESNPDKKEDELEKNDIEDFFYEITLSLSLKEIKTSTFNLRLNGIKDLDEFIEKNKNNKNMRDKIIDLIKKNELIQEIFGANYHSQIINKSKEIVKLLLLENQLNKDDIELIWNCTKRGDLEAKITILKLLSELADNLKDDYVEMLLSNIKATTDGKKINNEELELVYKLSLKDDDNKKNILICCEYLCNCLLSSPNPKISGSPILDKLLNIAQKDDIYLKKILEICEDCIKKNDKAILSYSILFEIMDKINRETNECIQNLIKDQYLLHLFEDNFRLYNKQANEIMEKNNIPSTDAKSRDKYVINGFSHSDNINKRIETLGNLVKYVYKDFDYISFLKEILITNAVSPNDKLIFYQFVKSFITNDSAAGGEENEEEKMAVKQKLFDLISKNDENEVTLEEMNLFVSLFFELNKDKILYQETQHDDDNDNDNNSKNKIKIKILSLEKIEDLKGLDKLWDMTFKIKSEKILSQAINVLFKIYETNFLPNLLEKCKELMLGENSNSQIFEKCIKLLKLIIIESEKKNFIKPKSHLSLLKNCFVNLPLEIKSKPCADDYEKIILFGNATMNDLKLLVGNLYKSSPKCIDISINDDYFEKIKKCENCEDKELFKKKELDESYNNISLYQLLQIKNKLLSDIKPSDKIVFEYQEKPLREELLIDGKMNPKLEQILKEWYDQFTEGEKKMTTKGIAKFVQGVSEYEEEVSENESKVTGFLESNDKDNKGYVSEEEFIQFYQTALENKKTTTVWKNLKNMGIRKDLRKKDEPFEIIYNENEKLPRYQLGNDIDFINKMIKQYYKNPENNYVLLDFLMFITTNQNIYNDVLNMFNSNEAGENNNEDNLVNKILKEDNKYVELNYVFIIIESILQDLEINLYLQNSHNEEEITFEEKEYKLFKENYEPFDKEENKEKKLNFLRNLIKSENFNKILKCVNDLLIKIEQTENENKVYEILFDCCFRGIKIINLINVIYKINKNSNISSEGYNLNSFKELKDIYIYDLGYSDLSNLLKDFDYQSELNKVSYSEIVKNIFNLISKGNKTEKSNTNFDKVYLNLLLDLLSTNSELFNEYNNDEQKKQQMISIFKKLFSDKDKEKSQFFIKYIDEKLKSSIEEQNYNNNYIKFLYKLCNSLLNSLITDQSKIENQEENKNLEKAEAFTPQPEFFDLYNDLNKIVETLVKENKIAQNEKDDENESFSNKVYDLLMKELIEDNNKDEENTKNKRILNFLKLLEISVGGDEEKINEILLEKDKTKNLSLFDIIYKKYLSILNNKPGDNKNDESNELISKSEETTNMNNDEDDKFILLEEIKRAKEEDNSSTEELNKYYSEIVCQALNYSKDQTNIPKLISLINILKKLTKKDKNGNDSDSDDRDFNNINAYSYYQHHSSKKQCDHVGLKNLGCICYMNSTMQQMYMVPTFRRAIMWSDDGKAPNPSSNYRYSCDDDNLLHQLQEMYTYLTYSEKMDYNPKGFCYSCKDLDGNPVNIAAQQDSQEFLNNFCDKIENSLKPTKFKHIVADVFTGKTCSSVLCDKCKHISNRFEDFYTLTLEVKNLNNLNDSLHKLIVPEIIDDFKCSNCNQNVRISKITSLNKLPNVLIIHLKRFYLDYETCHTTKINSKMEFPRKLNLKEFCIEEITKNYTISKEDSNDDIYEKENDYYQYELKGINIHTGSADGGHYFSYIDSFREGEGNIMAQPQNGKDNWLTFNDSSVSKFDTDKISSECFGGNTEGYSFENCQNAYLLIYERRKKEPIRILLNENEKKNVENNANNIIKINKENQNQIFKEYDLSRLGNTLDEKTLYEKVFYDEDKQEYYKYIPYYNIPKYAPKKYYNEVMKDNNKKTENKTDNKLNKQLLKKYKNILLTKSKEVDFRKDEIKTDSDKQCVLSILLGDYMQKIKSNNSFDDNDTREINEGFIFLKERLVDPIISEDADINLLQIINEHLGDEDNCSKLFCNSNGYFSSDKPLLTNENCEKYVEILEKLINIFNNKSSYMNYREELEKILNTLMYLIKTSKTKKGNYLSSSNDMDDDDENENDSDKSDREGIIYVYKLLYKLAKEHEDLCKVFISRDIVEKIINKLPEHIKPIRNIICDVVLYSLKQLEEYNKKYFNLAEDEKEGKISVNTSGLFSRHYIKSNQTTILYNERPEILKILFTIIGQNNSDNISEIKEFSEQIFKKYENDPEKLYPLLDIISSQIQINDRFTYDRFTTIVGYPSLVVRPIPKEEDEDNENNSYRSNSDNENDNKDSDKEEENKKAKANKKVKQKWPLFGERLIDGNINKEIYEYILSNHNYSYKCLLAILFPSEYRRLDENNKIIKISEEKKKEVLLDMIKSIFNERNNYPLFKYLYLMPARSLLHKNLYSEIISYLDINNIVPAPFDLEKMKEKETKYKEFVEKEVKGIIDAAVKRDENPEESRRYNYYRGDSDENDYDDDIYEGMFFECNDKNMKFFTGFIADSIPGEIIREDIFGIAQNSQLAMYRIHYYTKYYQIDELRDRLLNPEKYKKDDDDDKKSVKSNDSKSSKKSKLSSSSSRSKSVSSKKSKDEGNKEDDKDNENKEESNDNENKEDKKSDQEENKPDEEEKKSEEEERKPEEEDKKPEEDERKPEDEEKKEEEKKSEEEGNKPEEEVNKPEEEKRPDDEEKKEKEKKPDEEEKKPEEEENKPEEKENKPNEEDKKSQEEKNKSEEEEEKREEKDKRSDEEEKKSEDEDKKSENSRKKSDSEEEKPHIRKSSSSSKNNSPHKSKKNEEKEEKEEEYTNSEIDKELENRSNAEKFDISEKNENAFLYTLYKKHHDIFILEDKEKKDRNNVKNLLTRYVFSFMKGDDKKHFNAKVKPQNSIKSQAKKNCFLIGKINDSVEPGQATGFWNMQRFRENLKFISKDDIIISIGFQGSD